MQIDNTVLASKIRLRREMLGEVEAPVVYETHGGLGEVWRYCYASLPTGVVTETDPKKAQVLAAQRPTWAVYKGRAEVALAAGAVEIFGVNIVDMDPYGSAWLLIDALFSAPLPELLVLVVHDGMMRKAKQGAAWTCAALLDAVAEHGNEWVKRNYKHVCREMVERKAAQAGLSLCRWEVDVCGAFVQQLNYAAVLARTSSP